MTLRTPRPALLVAALFVSLVLTAPAAAQTPDAGAPAGDAATLERVELPPALDRVLRDYEEGWRARDAAALAALFTEDGFVLSPGRPPARGRAAIEARYRGWGGPLHLWAYDFATEGDVGWIVGGYAATAEGPAGGKFTLTLRRAADGRWLIHSDMDNGDR